MEAIGMALFSLIALAGMIWVMTHILKLAKASGTCDVSNLGISPMRHKQNNKFGR